MLDRILHKDIEKLIEDSVRLVHSNPAEMADFFYAKYRELDRLDKLEIFLWRLRHRMSQ